MCCSLPLLVSVIPLNSTHRSLTQFNSKSTLKQCRPASTLSTKTTRSAWACSCLWTLSFGPSSSVQSSRESLPGRLKKTFGVHPPSSRRTKPYHALHYPRHYCAPHYSSETGRAMYSAFVDELASQASDQNMIPCAPCSLTSKT